MKDPATVCSPYRCSVSKEETGWLTRILSAQCVPMIMSVVLEPLEHLRLETAAIKEDEIATTLILCENNGCIVYPDPLRCAITPVGEIARGNVGQAEPADVTGPDLQSI
jgi:hypothetical protein